VYGDFSPTLYKENERRNIGVLLLYSSAFTSKPESKEMTGKFTVPFASIKASVVRVNHEIEYLVFIIIGETGYLSAS
jgi:hypothetical protein